MLNLVSLILNKEATIENASTNVEKMATNLAQSLQFNAVKTKRRHDGFLSQFKSNEPPFLVKIGLLVHAKTRKKLLVEKLAAEGLSIALLLLLILFNIDGNKNIQLVYIVKNSY